MNTDHTSPDATICVDELAPSRASLRIAVVTETYPPDINGVARTMARTVQGLRDLGHAITVIRPRHPSEVGGDAPQPDVLVKGMPIPFYRQLRVGLPAKRELTRLWSHKRPDVVHIATEGPLGWSALKVARKMRIPVSTDFRTNFHAYTEHYKVGLLKKPIIAYLRKFHNLAHSTMVPTEQLRQELHALGFERLHAVPRGVDVGHFDPAKRSDAVRQNWGAADGDVVLLCVARLAAEKNLSVLLQVFNALQPLYPHLRLVVAGDGPQRENLQRESPRALFTGFLDEKALAAHYASADVFVFPSVSETFGNVCLEAMASGLPVVAYDDAAARLLVQHGSNGLLAHYNPAQGGTTDMQALLTHTEAMVRDSALRQRCAAAARDTAQGMSWAAIFAQVERVLLHVAAQS
ncbi:glycosyltransferase family 1 protein [Curvibacter sp. CHRR-16]|uniref:glycosyltransferase family 4 protein n=1 Tax=Curvibacter sp. CHRR-16 TaxID=2835872 RepID=UPI001BD97FB3|nr:glycosyltransferase family 1 protein [Curvibacter sp. CHRR-16]MBT0570106.1 glycosyltransferase family 1 protein [Curvibacter sp. CHRR-16]